MGQQIIRRQDTKPLEDTQPQHLEQDEAEVQSSPVENAVPVDHPPTPDDGGSRGAGLVPEPHSSYWFQNTCDQLRDQHNDLQTQIQKVELEASTLFKVQETKLQEILTSVKNIVGPRVAKWIDEDVAASMKAGKLVLRDFSALDAQFSPSNNDHGGPLGSGRDGGEGNGEGSGRANSNRKGKRKIREDGNNISEDEVEKSITMHRSLSSSAGPSATSHPTTSHLFNPSAFPRVRPPPPPPQRPRETMARPLKRDTMRLRTNPDTGEPEIFDYEATEEYRTRVQRDRYLRVDFRADFETMSEFDGPHFKFDRDAWRSFEDHTLMS